MALQGFPELVQVATSTVGTGPLTLGAAAVKRCGVGQLVNGQVYDYYLEDPNGTDVESGSGTFTSAGTILSRDRVYRSKIAGTEGVTKLTLSAGGASVAIGPSGALASGVYVAIRSFIAGCLITKHTGANTIDITPGSFFDPSTNRVVNYAGVTGLSAGTLGASQHHQVYGYDNNGTPSIEIVNNANPPSTAYQGTARQGGSGGLRRWLGGFITDATSNLLLQTRVVEVGAGAVKVMYSGVRSAGSYRALAAGTNTGAWSSLISFLAAIPPFVTNEVLGCVTAAISGGSGDVKIQLTADSSQNVSLTDQAIVEFYVNSAAVFPSITLWFDPEPSTPGIYYCVTGSGTATGANLYLDLYGFKFSR